MLFNLVKNGLPYLENFIPTELDSKANFARVAAPARRQHRRQAKAAAATEKIAQRIRLTQRKQMANFKIWAQSYK